MLRNTLVLLVCLFGLLPGHAQERPERRNCKITLLSIEKDLDHLHIQTPEGWKKLFIPSGQFPDPIDITTDGSFALYTSDEEAGMTPAAQVALPETSNDLLLLLFPIPDQPGRFRIFPMDFSSRQFPQGAFTILNLTSRIVIGRIDGTQIQIGARDSSVLRPQSGRRTLPVLFAYPGQSAQDSLLSTTWFHNPRHRYLVFLYPHQDEERIGVRTLRHFPKPDPQDPN